jgi:nucleotide-binding universal stress UspA family protein
MACESKMGTLASNHRQVERLRPPPRPLVPQGGGHRILVCIDRSPFSEACLPHAVAIAKSLGSAITLLYVMQPPHEQCGVHTTDVLDWELSSQEARAYLERLEREGTKASGRHVETRLEQGHPAERITSVSREIDADITVLGSHGERGVTAWTLGSTALQVLAVTRGSVLVVRPDHGTASEISPKRILVPLDGSIRSESALPTAVRIAGDHGSELLLVLVVPEPVPTALLRTSDDLAIARDLAVRLERNARRYLEGLRSQLDREGVSARTLVLRSADEKQALLDLSQRERNDLIVLSAHGTTCNPALTCGSVTAHLLAHSSIPLLVLQDLHGSELREREGEPRAPPLRASFPEDV